MVNMTQTPLVSYPVMAARFGWGKSSAALLKSAKLYASSPFVLESGFMPGKNDKTSQGIKDMLDTLIKDGTIETSMAHDIAAAGSTDYLNWMAKTRASTYAKAMSVVSYPFHVTEVANRKITAIAAYELAMDKWGDHDRAVRSAKKIVDTTHFVYTQHNRARFMQGNVARVLFLFKQYSQQMTFLLGKSLVEATAGESKKVKSIARQQLAGILGGHFLFAGITGLPLVGLVGSSMEVLADLFGDDDEPWDWEVELRKGLADNFTVPGGEMIAKGPLRGLAPWDVAGRMSLSDLWYRPPRRELEGRAMFAEQLQNLLGPVASNTASLFAGLSAIGEGKPMRGLEMMLPKALKDVLKSGRYATEGVKSFNGDELIKELTFLELTGQLIGLSPARVTEMYAGKSAIKNKETYVLRRRKRLLSAEYNAKTTKEKRKIRKAQREFSKKHPELAITKETRERSFKARERHQKGTMKGVYLPGTRQWLREEGRFANL
jgi:hypothetical protein